MPGSDLLEAVPEQGEAKRLLRAALDDGPAHAYLFHGPPGVGKRRAARAFAAALIEEDDRVERATHPDLYVLRPLGDQIRIDDIRALRHDLHMRPYEAKRRVYLVLSAELMNDEAADALLKDLEEPPAYAVLVLVADDVGPLSETIRSRCQDVPFSRLSERAIREQIVERAPGLGATEATALARVSGGRLDRAEQLLDPAAARRREKLIEAARGVYADVEFDPTEATRSLLEGAKERGEEAKAQAREELEGLELPAREADQRLRRAQRGAEREHLLQALEELAAWYRDLVAVAIGAPEVAMHYDRLDVLRKDGVKERMLGAERAAELVRETWRRFEEFNISPALAFEALFVKLRRELAGAVQG